MTKIMRTLWDESAELTDEAMRKYNKKRAIVFATLQMYRHDRMPYLRRILDDAKEKGYIAGVKFVREESRTGACQSSDQTHVPPFTTHV